MLHDVTIPHGMAIAKYGLLATKSPMKLNVEPENIIARNLQLLRML
jgi:hypothetical protein